MKLWFKRYLKKAVSLEGRPWDVVPDYRKRVEVTKDVDFVNLCINENVPVGVLKGNHLYLISDSILHIFCVDKQGLRWVRQSMRPRRQNQLSRARRRR